MSLQLRSSFGTIKASPRVGAVLLAALTLSSSVTGSSAFAQSSPPTVSTPPLKSTEKAAQDLKREVPLDLSKLGDPLPRNLFVELSKLINPTVVSITTSTAPKQRGRRSQDPLQQFLEEFYGGRIPGMNDRAPQPMQGLGTGFIIREDGLIVTNAHVVAQADIIKVQLDSRSTTFYEAEVVGRDTQTDIALIKIDAKKPLPFAKLGTSREVEVGEWVAAFGNPYGHAHTMTKGIVSAIGREIAELNRFPFLQTDASINPGNSGGPLVNTRGLVIGVNTAVDARAQGIGFAIPIDEVKQVIDQLEKDGRVRRGYIGVGMDEINEEMAAALGMEEPKGVLISQVVRTGTAYKAGVKPYDIVVEFAGKPTNTLSEFRNIVGNSPIGSTQKMKIRRYKDNGSHTEVALEVKIGENPNEGGPKQKAPKQYLGQKAPFDLGFKVSDFSASIAEEFGLPADAPQGPVVIDVTRGSPAAYAGFQPGDVIVDVNRAPMTKATDVIKALKKGRNILRLRRGTASVIVTIGK
jgi:serine protease Do